MTVNMLKAISKMLEVPEEYEVVSLLAKIGCAKIMLDEVIKGLEGDMSLAVKESLLFPSAMPTGTSDFPPAPHPPATCAKPQKREAKPGEVKIVLDSSRRIAKIENFPLDGKLMLDNVITTHKDAIGKTFTEGKIL